MSTRRPRTPMLLALLLTLGPAAGCAEAEPRAEVRVFAAASLGPAFEVLADRFEESQDITVSLHVAGTPRLLLALEEGARADVFAPADEALMERAVVAGFVVEEPRVFAHGRLALVVPPGNPGAVHGLEDLEREALRVGLCAPGVPAGRYARELLRARGLRVRAVSDEPSVSALATKVRLGEVDAALVYRTDLGRAGHGLEEIPFAAGDAVRATYPAARLAAARSPEAAERFVAFLFSEAGRGALSEFGFELP